MAEKITIEDARVGIGACGALIFGLSVAIFLFNGEPDVHDLTKTWLANHASVSCVPGKGE